MLNNKRVLILNGVGTSGKGEFARCVYELLNEQAIEISTVDLVKEAAKILGWNGEKDEKSRKFLSDLKLLSVDYIDHSYKYAKKKFDFFSKQLYFKVLMIDVREPEEIERFKKEFDDAKTILVRRPDAPKIESNMADANVENYQYDYIIENDGTLEDLKRKTEEFLKELER
jgi:hypothetical protein